MFVLLFFMLFSSFIMLFYTHNLQPNPFLAQFQPYEDNTVQNYKFILKSNFFLQISLAPNCISGQVY